MKVNSDKKKSQTFSKTAFITNTVRVKGYFGTGEISKNTTYCTPRHQAAEFLVIPRDALESKMTLKHQLQMMTDRMDYERTTSPELYRYSNHLFSKYCEMQLGNKDS
mgnify:FL=1